MRNTALLHIETDPLWADHIAATVRAWSDVRHVGNASTHTAALNLVTGHAPDFILLDTALPVTDLFFLAKTLAEAPTKPRVFLLARQLAPYLMYRCADTYINGVLLKTPQGCAHLRQAILTPGPQKYFPAEVRTALGNFRTSADAFYKFLSPREIVLLRQLATEWSEETVSATTGLSIATIRWHKYKIMAKLGLHKNIELVQWTQRNGFNG